MSRSETRRWTPEDDAKLTRLWAEGRSTAEIGRYLGVSKNSVIGRVHRLGMPSRPSPILPRANKTKRVKRAPKITLAAISLDAVVSDDSRASTRPVREAVVGQWTDEAVSKLVSMWAAGDETNTIARVLGFSKNAIFGKVNRLGLPTRSALVRGSKENARLTQDWKPHKQLQQPVACPRLVSPPARQGRVSECVFVTSADRPWRYCNEPTLPGRSYCEHHDKISYARSSSGDVHAP